MSDSQKSLNDLIVDASETIREITRNPEYQDLVAQKDESFAPAADAYGAIVEISALLHAKETKE